MFSYTGDYTADTDKACFTNGTASKDGTILTATVDASYVTWSTAGDYILWAVSSGDGVSSTQGTIFFSLYVVDTVGDGTAIEIGRDTWDGDNYIRITVYGTDDKIRAYHVSDPDGDTTENSQNVISTGGITANTWYRVGYTWKVGNPGGHRVSVVALGNDPSWEAEADSNTLTDFNASLPIQNIVVGNKGIPATPGEARRVANVVILSGYAADDPLQ